MFHTIIKMISIPWLSKNIKMETRMMSSSVAYYFLRMCKGYINCELDAGKITAKDAARTFLAPATYRGCMSACVHMRIRCLYWDKPGTGKAFSDVVGPEPDDFHPYFQLEQGAEHWFASVRGLFTSGQVSMKDYEWASKLLMRKGERLDGVFQPEPPAAAQHCIESAALQHAV